MYEERMGTNSAVDDAAKELGKNSVIKSQNEEGIGEKRTQQISEKLEEQDKREVGWTNFKNWMKALNDEVFNRFINNNQGLTREAGEGRQILTNKRKMETQERFPTKKR
ncbi:hypothetical protein JTB14_032831 [Gonioctena quinquepunctata]|nr:hypothetical protein JTB14_032831 [Gonioctena quinquepunctata]